MAASLSFPSSSSSSSSIVRLTRICITPTLASPNFNPRSSLSLTPIRTALTPIRYSGQPLAVAVRRREVCCVGGGGEFGKGGDDGSKSGNGGDDGRDGNSSGGEDKGKDKDMNTLTPPPSVIDDENVTPPASVIGDGKGKEVVKKPLVMILTGLLLSAGGIIVKNVTDARNNLIHPICQKLEWEYWVSGQGNFIIMLWEKTEGMIGLIKTRIQQKKEQQQEVQQQQEKVEVEADKKEEKEVKEQKEKKQKDMVEGAVKRAPEAFTEVIKKEEKEVEEEKEKKQKDMVEVALNRAVEAFTEGIKKGMEDVVKDVEKSIQDSVTMGVDKYFEKKKAMDDQPYVPRWKRRRGWCDCHYRRP